jgi:hypothetical protein
MEEIKIARKQGRPKGFDAKEAELHLGILQNRMARLRGKMQAVAAKMNMDPEKVEGGIDKPALEAEFGKLNEEHLALELVLREYEDDALAKTALKEPS